MRIKAYNTTKSARVRQAIKDAGAYLADVGVTFEPIEAIKIDVRDQDLYELDLVATIKNFRQIKIIKPRFIRTLDTKGCDAIILFIDKEKAREEYDLYGAATSVNGVPCIQIYDSNKYIHYTLDPRTGLYAEEYNNSLLGLPQAATTHALIHEIFHAFSQLYPSIFDDLHPFIMENQFDAYKHYLQVSLAAMNNQNTNSEKLFAIAMNHLNTDVTPADPVPDAVDCMDTISTLIHLLNPRFPVVMGTYTGLLQFQTSPLFTPVSRAEKGAVLIYATGTGNGSIPGHVFICDDFQGDDTLLYSNSSSDGIFKQNYTLKTAQERYAFGGGFAGHYFKLK